MEQEKSNLGAIALAIIITAVVVGGGVYWWQQNKPVSTQETATENIITNNESTQLETKRGTLIAHPQDAEAAYLKMDDGTELFLVDQSRKVIFPAFIGKRVEVKGSMSYPLNPEAIDQWEFDVVKIYSL